MDNSRLKPLATTIIPTYRHPDMLKRAIKSVLNQTYPYFQVCVYDNASGDETRSVAQEFAKNDSRIKYHCHPANIGSYKNFIYGMERVNTPFFSFLSDDDIILPEFYQTAVEGLEKYPEAGFLATLTAYMDYSGYLLSPFTHAWKEGLYKPPSGAIQMLKRGAIPWTGTLFRKEIIEKTGTLDEKVGMASDLDFVLRAANHFPFVVSSKGGAILFVNHLIGNETRRFHSTWPGWLKMIRNIAEDEQIPSDVRADLEQILTEQLKKRLFQTGIASIIRKNFDDTYQAADVLNRHYHLRIWAFFLSALVKVCQYFPPAYYCISFLDKTRRAWKKHSLRHLQEVYWNYVRPLE